MGTFIYKIRPKFVELSIVVASRILGAVLRYGRGRITFPISLVLCIYRLKGIYAFLCDIMTKYAWDFGPFSFGGFTLEILFLIVGGWL